MCGKTRSIVTDMDKPISSQRFGCQNSALNVLFLNLDHKVRHIHSVYLQFSDFGDVFADQTPLIT